VKVNTRNILFICGGSFKGIEDIILKRIQGGGIGFSAKLKDTSRDYITSEIVLSWALSVASDKVKDKFYKNMSEKETQLLKRRD
jgi:ATP-dependent protease Clp, ATPase subunit